MRAASAASAGGIIPAYAGSTTPSTEPRPAPADHPRIRGEHAHVSHTTLSRVGSSPHTRGALLGWALCRGLRRIIPAYAGSTFAVLAMPAVGRDHPRIRGEHPWARDVPFPQVGSSPHTRGARLSETTTHERQEDHPRIRGEHPAPRPPRTSPSGSSPHTRGAPPRRPAHRDPVRIIPAYAGSTRRGSLRRPGLPDHPRIRGEHSRRLIQAR